MKITIALALPDDTRRLVAKMPYVEADHVTIATACPNCGHEEPTKISGSGISHHDHDTYYASAVALCCKVRIGQIQTKVETLFGIDEDNAVLHGCSRVY